MTPASGQMSSEEVSEADAKDIRRQLSSRFAFEMARYERLMRQQLSINADDLSGQLRMDNFFNLIAPFNYAADILLGVR